MPIKEILLLLVVIAVLLTVPVGVIWGIVDYVKNGRRRERRGGGGAGIGSAMMELDRLVARPSVEYVVEAQTQVTRREDDQGGDDPPGARDSASSPLPSPPRQGEGAGESQYL